MSAAGQGCQEGAVEMITIRRVPGANVCFGGICVTDSIAFPCRFPAAVVEIWDDDKLVTQLSRDEATVFADTILECAHDA